MAEESMPQESMKIRYTEPRDGVFSTYSNNVALQPSSFDLKLVFCEAVSIDEDKTVVVEQKVKVHVSWLEAKVLANFLAGMVANYEAKNGPITQPVLPEPVKLLNIPFSRPPE
jgi:hypothetical protein